jgi:excisionase family DNA binding protein
MEIFDIPQLAEKLRVSKRAVRSYLCQGKLIGRKVGKRWLVTEDALRAFLMNNESNVTKSSPINE